MLQRPNAIALLLCQKVIVEEGTKNVTLVNTFRRLDYTAFPTPPRNLDVFGLLTDGLGPMTLSLVLTRLDTLEELLAMSQAATFSNLNEERRLRIRVRGVVFPIPGRYQFALLANGEWVAQCVLRLNHVGS